MNLCGMMDLAHSAFFGGNELVHLLPFTFIGGEVSHDGKEATLGDRSDVHILGEYSTECDICRQESGNLLI